MVAVVAMPHKNGVKRPVRLLSLPDGVNTTVDELRDWCKKELAGFKVPNKFVFADPKTSTTGKVCRICFSENRF